MPTPFLRPNSAPSHGGLWSSQKENVGFTLVELLIVVAIILVVMGLAIPAMNAIKGSGDVTKAAYDVSGTIEGARAYAIANNTYTWVGFYEEDPSNGSPTESNRADTAPPYPGKGRVVIGVVASNDGTPIYGNNDPAATLPSISLTPINKLLKIENAHLVDLGAPSGGDPGTLNGRPSTPYEYGKTSKDKFNRVNSESAVYAQFPFSLQNYTFRKTIMFNPRGEANVVETYGKYALRPVLEIGLRPTRGNMVLASDPNVVAIQVTGIAGNVKIYRP